MQPRVAIVEDEEHLREAVVEYLSGFGMLCRPAANGQEFRSLLEAEPLDVVVLDIAMPGEDGLSLARTIRARGTKPGIIFATAAGASIDRVVGLEIGADDYLVKPYELRELLARIRSVMRRLPDGAHAPVVTVPPQKRSVQVGRFAFDLESRSLRDDAGSYVALTPMEGELLATFVTRPRRVLSRAQLLDLAGGRDGAESDRSIDIRVTRLRRKIEPDSENPSLIRTVRGEGYVYEPDGR